MSRRIYKIGSFPTKSHTHSHCCNEKAKNRVLCLISAGKRKRKKLCKSLIWDGFSVRWEEDNMGERDNLQEEDPFGFMLGLSRVSESQEQLLHSNLFVGETQNSTQHDTASPVDAELPVASAPIIVVSPPDTRESPQDVFHTPPEESSLPSSDDQQRTLAVDVDVDVERCAFNQAVDVDAGTQAFVDLGGFLDGSDFVDLGRDSELGFLEVQLTQEIHAKLVPDCSRGADGDGSGEIPQCRFDELGILEREFSDLGELPLKKLKPSEQNFGFHPSEDFSSVQLLKVEEGMGNCDDGKPVSDADVESPCNSEEHLQPQENALGYEQVPVDSGNKNDFCREISMEKNVGTEENFETEVVQLDPTVTSAGDVNMIGGNKSGDEVVEGSGMLERRLENAVNELESREGREKKKCSVFDVLGVLSDNNRDVEGNVDDVSLLDVAKLNGLTFPRSMDNNVGTGENIETEVVQLDPNVTSAGDVNMIEVNKSGDEVVEGSGMRERSLENAVNELESRKGRKKKKSVFDVLRVLSENNRDVEDNVDDISLLDAAMLNGLTFPRPRWWPDNYNFNNQS